MTGSERLFFALWPDSAVVSQLKAAWQKVAPASGRHIATRNWHVTLAFLGMVDTARRDCMERVVSNICGTTFLLPIDHIEWRRRQGIVWAGAREVPAALTTLVTELTRHLAGCGYEPEARAYGPHITLARDVRHCEFMLQSVPLISWTVEDFCLAKSQASSSGSEYTILRRWPLAKP